MVRLKATTPYNIGDTWTEFQFHYGSIKSDVKMDFNYAQPNFNSTMVRLKEKSE